LNSCKGFDGERLSNVLAANGKRETNGRSWFDLNARCLDDNLSFTENRCSIFALDPLQGDDCFAKKASNATILNSIPNNGSEWAVLALRASGENHRVERI